MREITIRSDAVFQIIFGVSKNIDITIDLLKAILASEGKSTKITNPIIQTEVSLEKLKLNEKRGRLDVRIETDERIYCIEMQNKNSTNIYKRANFYISRQMSSQLQEGQRYQELKPITVIFIINGRMSKENKKEYNDFKEHIITVNKNYRDINIDLGFDFIFLYLKDYKKNKKHDIKVPINQWVSLLNYNNEEDLEMAIKLNENVKKANEEFLRLKEEEREAARIKEIEESVWIEDFFCFDEGRIQGRKEGKKEGRREGEKIGQKKVAKKLLLQKVDDKIILNATGLSKGEFEELKKQTKYKV